jgi:hypothetical protein
MEYVSLVDFLQDNWRLWLLCAIFFFALRVWLAFKTRGRIETMEGSRFLQVCVEMAMWFFGLVWAASIVCLVGRMYGVL